MCVFVLCSDGLGRSGTFCALYSVLERLKIEQVIDVFQAIKAMRISRPGLVKTAVSSSLRSKEKFSVLISSVSFIPVRRIWLFNTSRQFHNDLTAFFF